MVGHEQFELFLAWRLASWAFERLSFVTSLFVRLLAHKALGLLSCSHRNIFTIFTNSRCFTESAPGTDSRRIETLTRRVFEISFRSFCVSVV